jgi:hypothetical protein
MTAQNLKRNLAFIDAQLIVWMWLHSLTLLRIAVGIIYVWFGALKLFPALSPAEPLIRGALTAVQRSLRRRYHPNDEQNVGVNALLSRRHHQ